MPVTDVRIGYSPLNDAALILVAESLGFYDSEGLRVSLSREANWSNIRDKLAYGLIDAAHILAPMPFAAALGLGPSMGRIIAPMALGANGNAVLVSAALKARLDEGDATPGLMGSARMLAREVERRRKAGLGRLVFAVPFTWSPHHFVLRHWVASAGLDPEHQIQWIVVPPSRMAAMLKDRVIDGFSSGSPWPQTAQLNGEGEILFADPDYWTLKPEKVLGIRAAWAEDNAEATIGLTRALLRAGQWAADTANSEDLIRILARRSYVNAPWKAIEMALGPSGPGLGGSGFIADPERATFPWISHAKWFMGQMVKWGMLTPEHDFDQLARHVYRPDLWREAAGSLGLNLPTQDEKEEGGHIGPWSLPAQPQPIAMPANALFDGGVFRCGPTA